MKKGFTVFELLVTIAVIAVLATVSLVTLSGWHTASILTDTAKQISALLREAQSDTMAQSKGAAWGVHFDNTTTTSAFYSLFYTFNGTYASSVMVGRYPLPAGVYYATSSVTAGSSVDVVFNGLAGASSASTTITLQSLSSGAVVASSSVTISLTGMVN